MWGRARETDTGWVGAGPDDDLDVRLQAEEEPFDPGQPQVRTLLGPIVPEALGPTLVGESLAALARRLGGRPRGVAARDALLAELEDAYAAGVRGVVARANSVADLDDLTWLAARAPVHLVATAPPDLATDSDRSVGAMSIELSDTPATDVSVALAAELQRDMALPVEIRSRDAAAAVGVARSLIDGGARAEHVWVGGCDWGNDEQAARQLLDIGVAVAFGVLGSPVGGRGGTDWERQAALIAALAGAGYADQLLLGSGIDHPAGLRVGGGEFGLGGVVERVPLALMEAGAGAMAVRRMLIDGPARALTIEAEV